MNKRVYGNNGLDSDTVPAGTHAVRPAIPAGGVSVNWRDTFDRSLEAGDVESAARLLEDLAFDLLGTGSPEPLQAAIACIPAQDRSLLLRIADADIAMRSKTVQLPHLQRLQQQAEDAASDGKDDYRAWLAAIFAEHFFWKGDLLALGITETALAGIPDEPLLPVHVLLARARLRRINAIGGLFVGTPEGHDKARHLLTAALKDFSRAGWEEERAMSATMFATLWTLVSWDDIGDARSIADESAARLHALGSDYTPIALVGLAMIAFLQGDMAAAHAAVDKAEGLAGPPYLAGTVVIRHLRAFARLIGEGPGDDVYAALDEVAAGLRAQFMEGAGAMVVAVAAVLADLGEVEAAKHWFGRAHFSEPLTPYSHFDTRSCEIRLEILDTGDEAAVDSLRTLVRQMRAVGLGRLAGVNCLRAARDCERVGLPGVADTLRTEGLALVPPPKDRTLWEALWAHPLLGREAGIARPVLHGQIRVLLPELEVRRGEQVIRLPGGAARLLALLVTEAKPLTVDALADMLWPEIDLPSGRQRLNAAIYRLRKLLGLDQEELLIRRGDTVLVDPAGKWRIDAWEFWERSGGGLSDRLTALELYESDLCAQQLAYDDAVAESRSRLRARWTDLAASLLRDGDVDARLLAERVVQLGIEDGRLLDPLADALAAAGHTAEAVTVRSLSLDA
ncbi:MAG: hypothetical protein IT198_05560 [Acidimicrobiia bacterium]|nr:hypothetical protein [Acidimicrobiia bacterium]